MSHIPYLNELYAQSADLWALLFSLITLGLSYRLKEEFDLLEWVNWFRLGVAFFGLACLFGALSLISGVDAFDFVKAMAMIGSGGFFLIGGVCDRTARRAKEKRS